MKSFRQLYKVKTAEKEEVVDITGMVKEALDSSGITEGLALVFPHHTSSAVYLSDSDQSLALDYLDVTGRLVPGKADYRHNDIDYKHNAAAHLKAILTGLGVTLPVTDGRLDLGLYQTVYYAEFDGGREKSFLVKVIGE